MGERGGSAHRPVSDHGGAASVFRDRDGTRRGLRVRILGEKISGASGQVTGARILGFGY